jgi:hypothetical protein
LTNFTNLTTLTSTTTATATETATATKQAGDILGNTNNPLGIAGVRSPTISVIDPSNSPF